MPRRPLGCPLGNQLEPLEQPGRQHRPQHESRRRDVVLGDPAREPERKRWQQRPVGPDTVDDRLGRYIGEPSRLRDHDPESLPPAELDEHGLAKLEIGQGGGHEVGVGPVPSPSGGIDRDLDGSPAAGRLDGPAAPRRLDRSPSVRQGDLELDRVAARHGERE